MEKRPDDRCPTACLLLGGENGPGARLSSAALAPALGAEFCISVTDPTANRLGLNRRTLYASKLPSRPIYASHLETGAKPLLLRLRMFCPTSGHFMLSVAATLHFN
jgi:hypothetical protein